MKGRFKEMKKWWDEVMEDEEENEKEQEQEEHSLVSEDDKALSQVYVLNLGL